MSGAEGIPGTFSPCLDADLGLLAGQPAAAESLGLLWALRFMHRAVTTNVRHLAPWRGLGYVAGAARILGWTEDSVRRGIRRLEAAGCLRWAPGSRWAPPTLTWVWVGTTKYLAQLEEATARALEGAAAPPDQPTVGSVDNPEDGSDQPTLGSGLPTLGSDLPTLGSVDDTGDVTARSGDAGHMETPPPPAQRGEGAARGRGAAPSATALGALPARQDATPGDTTAEGLDGGGPPPTTAAAAPKDRTPWGTILRKLQTERRGGAAEAPEAPRTARRASG